MVTAVSRKLRMVAAASQRSLCLAFYTFRRDTDEIVSREFLDDDAAIAYALKAARGGAIEVWGRAKLLATVDERPAIVHSIRGAVEPQPRLVNFESHQNALLVP